MDWRPLSRTVWAGLVASALGIVLLLSLLSPTFTMAVGIVAPILGLLLLDRLAAAFAGPAGAAGQPALGFAG